MIPGMEEILMGLRSGEYEFRVALHWIKEHMRLAEERGSNSDMRALSDLLLIGDEGEPLVISSELESELTDKLDTCMRFEVRNPEGRSRYGVYLEITKLDVGD